MRKRLLAPLILLMLYMGCSHRNVTYKQMNLKEVIHNGREGDLVRVWGNYLAFGEFSQLIMGVITDGRYAVILEGYNFDRSLIPGKYVEVWGRLKFSNLQKPIKLEFHNFRYKSEKRHPRPANVSIGEKANLWLRLYLSGGEMQTVNGLSEDGQFFTIENYKGPVGIVCMYAKRKNAIVLQYISFCSNNEHRLDTGAE